VAPMAVGKTLDGPVRVRGAVAATGSGFVSHVKARSDVELLAASPGDCDRHAGHHHHPDRW